MFATSKANGREVFSWCLYDFANSAFATTILAVIFNRFYAGVVAGGVEGTTISFLGFEHHIQGAALFNFIVAFAMFIVAVSSPFLGAWADSSAAKKRFLAFYIALGVISTAMLTTLGPGDWLKGAVWFILADISFAGGNVFYNAFLNEISTPDEAGKVSGWGWGIGYIGGGLLLAINLIMLQAPGLIGFPEDFFTVQHTFLSVAIWWGLFSIPLLVNVRERSESAMGYRKAALEGIFRLKKTLKKIGKFKQLTRFLIAYLFFNDGVQTVIIMASIFGDQELGMGQELLIGYFLLIQFTAFVGSFLFGRLTTVMGNKKSLLLSLYIWCLVVIAGFLIGWTGHPVREYFVMGIFAGMVLGASQSIARGMQATFTPQGYEAEFFGFFAICGRFASILGPLTYGLMIMITGSLRFGILALIIFFIIGIILLLGVDENEGRLAAETSLD